LAVRDVRPFEESSWVGRTLYACEGEVESVEPGSVKTAVVYDQLRRM